MFKVRIQRNTVHTIEQVINTLPQPNDNNE